MTSRRRAEPLHNLRNRAGSAVFAEHDRAYLRNMAAKVTISKLAHALGTSVITLEKVIDGIAIRESAADGIRISLAVIGYRARVPEKSGPVKPDS